LEEAQEWALKHIKISRDVHSLEEAAGVIYSIAEKHKNTNFPDAIKHYKFALLLLKEAKELNPHFTTVRYSLANVLFKLKKYTESSTELFEINKIEKGTTEIGAFYMARNLLWTGAFEGGKEFCENWLKSFPDSIMIKRIYSELLIDGCLDGHLFDGELTEISKCAIDTFEFYREMIQDETNRKATDFQYFSKIYSWLGNRTNSAENINYAGALLDRGIELYPNHWQFNFYFAVLFTQNSKFKEALEEAFEAKRKAHWRETIYSLISSIYKFKGDTANAEKYNQEYLRLKAEKEQLYKS
jgi:tetratricopeptide (TPR) repeat protein